jgi:hypothetical protein
MVDYMGLSKEQLHSLTRRDPLAFGISYIDLLESKKWEVSTRSWATEIYQSGNPWVIEKYPVGQAKRVVVTKSTQAGISTWAMVKMFHFSMNWSVRIFYTLPRQQDVLDLVTTRIDPMIKASPYLKAQLGTPDSAHAKMVGNSYLFFMELSVEPRMMPADALFVDEVDLSDPDNMSTALNRLDASRWKLSYYLSTPTVPNYGIHGLYNSSDMRQWMVKCPKCNYEQPIDWEVNLRVEGPPSAPTKVYYGCVKCNAEITVPHMQTGRWVAEHPERSEDTIGYHVHQMLTTPAKTLYTLFRDPQTKLIEFYRKRLGKPYEIGGGSLERDDFLVSCFDEPYDFEPGYDGESTYFLGADQGNELQVLVAKIPPRSNRPKIVHVELIPMDKGFDRLAQLIQLYHIRRGVVDANPNRHAAMALTKKFPGRILVADYIEQKDLWKASKGQNVSYLEKVAINRTAGFDGLMESIKKGEWQLPGTPPTLHPDVELVIDHVTALKRDVESRKTQSGEIQVYVWKKLRPEHLAHAWLYMKTAKELDRGRSGKVAVIGAKPEENKSDPDSPDEDTITEITAILAEIPGDQIADYILHGDDVDYSPPFPLSYKLKRVYEEDFADEDILFVMNQLLKQKRVTS